MKVRRGHKGRRVQPVRPDLKGKKAILDLSGRLGQLALLVPKVQAAASARPAQLVHPARRVQSGPVACTH